MPLLVVESCASFFLKNFFFLLRDVSFNKLDYGGVSGLSFGTQNPQTDINMLTVVVWPAVITGSNCTLYSARLIELKKQGTKPVTFGCRMQMKGDQLCCSLKSRTTSSEWQQALDSCTELISSFWEGAVSPDTNHTYGEFTLGKIRLLDMSIMSLVLIHTCTDNSMDKPWSSIRKLFDLSISFKESRFWLSPYCWLVYNKGTTLFGLPVYVGVGGEGVDKADILTGAWNECYLTWMWKISLQLGPSLNGCKESYFCSEI